MLNERAIDEAFKGLFDLLRPRPDDAKDVRDVVDDIRGTDDGQQGPGMGAAFLLQVAKWDERLSRLPTP